MLPDLEGVDAIGYLNALVLADYFDHDNRVPSETKLVQSYRVSSATAD
jgi:DNA-binding GntR family transcriptional regulator